MTKRLLAFAAGFALATLAEASLQLANAQGRSFGTQVSHSSLVQP
jgi:hypothetical protein